MPPSAVWAVLADGWLYPVWVVGAARMREVDEHWPAVGARLHHSVGIWPLLIDDNTEVLESEPEQLLRLRTRGWPAGEAEVVIRLAAVGAGPTGAGWAADCAGADGVCVWAKTGDASQAAASIKAAARLALEVMVFILRPSSE